VEPHETHWGSQNTTAARRKAAGEDRGATQRHQAHASVDTVILQCTQCRLYYRLVSNTTGRRWTREECTAAFSAGIKFYAFEVTDQYTEYGLVGVLVVDATGIQQFVMSCRIMGLEAEAAAIAQITTIFADDGAENIFAAMVETDRNLQCREVYSNLGFVETTGGWQRATTPPLATPAHITMNVEEGTDVVAEVAA